MTRPRCCASLLTNSRFPGQQGASQKTTFSISFSPSQHVTLPQARTHTCHASQENSDLRINSYRPRQCNWSRPPIRPSVRPFVSTLSFEPTDRWIWVCVCADRDHGSPGIDSQGHRSRSNLMSSAYGRGNAVTRSVWPQSSIEDSFVVTDVSDAF